MGQPSLNRSGRWFSPEPCRDAEEVLAALTLEARRRGLTYGQLVGITSGYERQEIVEAYRRVRSGRRHR